MDDSIYAQELRPEGEQRMEYANILLQADEIIFDSEVFRVVDVHQEKYVIPYEETALVYIAVSNEKEWDLKKCYMPEIIDITKDMDGALIICNRQQSCFVIRTDRVKDTAAELLEIFVRYASHALFGFQPWLNECDAGQFEEILEMIDVMKECAF